MVLIDLTKAFDSGQKGLVPVLRKIDYPEKFVRIVQSFHDGTVCEVIDGGEMLAIFDITNGTKQGCAEKYARQIQEKFREHFIG